MPQRGRTTEGSHSAYTARRIGAASVERVVPALKRKPKSPQQQAAVSSGSGTTRASGASGGVQGVNVIILVLVAASVTIAAGLLAETVNTARAIDKKAKSIRDTGVGINTATDSIAQLVKTNQIASSILKTAAPLDGVLTKIVARAKSINRDATSIDSLASTILSTAGTINTSATTINGVASEINNTASEINGTAKAIDSIAGGINDVAGTINRTAKSINTTAGPGAGILGIARTIDGDAASIIQALTITLNTVNGIKSDSGDILGDATAIKDTAACIDVNANLGAPKAPKADCGGLNP
jgi:methyl-accepting chemotaxis protein